MYLTSLCNVNTFPVLVYEGASCLELSSSNLLSNISFIFYRSSRCPPIFLQFPSSHISSIPVRCPSIFLRVNTFFNSLTQIRVVRHSMRDNPPFWMMPYIDAFSDFLDAWPFAAMFLPWDAQTIRYVQQGLECGTPLGAGEDTVVELSCSRCVGNELLFSK